MTELRIIEMAMKPPFKYFVQKDGYFGGGSLPEELCFNSLTKAKEIIEKLLNAFASNDFFEEEELSAMAEAEQFLKEKYK